MSSKSLRYVSYNRNTGALNLIAQAEVSRKTTVARRFIDCSRDLSGLLPGLNIFEFLECCHFVSPLVDEGGLVFCCRLSRICDSRLETPDSRLLTFLPAHSV